MLETNLSRAAPNPIAPNTLARAPSPVVIAICVAFPKLTTIDNPSGAIVIISFITKTVICATRAVAEDI